MTITYDYKKDGNKKLSQHFELSEFKCEASNTIKYSTELIEMLEKIFTNCTNVGKCIINSGYRTPAYSVKVGGTKTDAHTAGIAADCVFYDKANKIIEPKYIACYAEELGFGGIGVMKTATHLDVRHLGGYTNKKWYGDETKDYSLSANNKTFYQYYNLTKDAVYKVLGHKLTEAVKKPEVKENPVSVTYTVRAGGKWLPAVKDTTDFAGIVGTPITDVAIKVSVGSVKYRVHRYFGGWLPYCTGYNTKDSKNGYAGNGKAIDAIEIIYTNPKGYSKKAIYRVSPVNKAYYAWQTNNEKSNTMSGYAGSFIKKIDRLQIKIN